MSGPFWLTAEQVERLRPHFPKARGKPKVDDRRMLSGTLHVLRDGLHWQDAPPAYGPHKMRHPRSQRTRTPASHGRKLYEKRGRVENALARLRHRRGIAMRHARCGDLFLSAVALAAAIS